MEIQRKTSTFSITIMWGHDHEQQKKNTHGQQKMYLVYRCTHIVISGSLSFADVWLFIANIFATLFIFGHQVIRHFGKKIGHHLTQSTSSRFNRETNDFMPKDYQNARWIAIHSFILGVGLSHQLSTSYYFE